MALSCWIGFPDSSHVVSISACFDDATGHRTRLRAARHCRMRRQLVLNAVLLLLIACFGEGVRALSAATPQGSAASPAAKKKIAVLGSGGYLGALTFGFLQRASSLFGTGMGNCRCIGATADTAVRLNRILGKHFCLAQADESFIKLTDLSSVESIQSRLEGWDAIVFGTDLFLQSRSVTANTYEKTPNDKA